MAGFVSHFTNRLDAKGRVSIPAPFRAVLTRDGYDGLFTIPSSHSASIDAGGNELVNEIEGRLAQYNKMSPEYDALAMALFGASETPKIDGDGRIVISDMVREITGITDQVTFTGLGYKFQIWHPDQFREHRAEVQRQARALLSGQVPGMTRPGEPA